LDLISWCQKP